jgi:hypothetical protein
MIIVIVNVHSKKNLKIGGAMIHNHHFKRHPGLSFICRIRIIAIFLLRQYSIMTDTENNSSNPEFNDADSKADAIAIFCLIAIAVGAMIYLANV